jgi:hypothetical protein
MQPTNGDLATTLVRILTSPRTDGERRDVRRNPSRLNFAEQLGRFLLPYIIIINVSKHLPLAVLDDVASEVIFNSPWWWEATRGGHCELERRSLWGRKNYWECPGASPWQ